DYYCQSYDSSLSAHWVF
nr:immunoglobulin light chain junction region [Macaca mulatta]MOX69592.1 immunoglobulin light chain junction region [Macaca mulatta]MOX71752.1 immunoglobulin light chain junction region [Macaca mulatta]MOX72697.1 immunoglobulin light chain junction region [Macaca mulatta]MOX73955.1 immunoglobulin light chain junction region [Macaca mulatta]